MQHDPGLDDEEHHRLFMLLLRAATASRMRVDDFARQQEIAATLRGRYERPRRGGATLLHRAWGNANEARTKLRYAWHEFFRRFDGLLTPVAATAAFRTTPTPTAMNVRSASMANRRRTRSSYSLRGSPVCHIYRQRRRQLA